MRAAGLLAAEAVDRAGHRLGRVHDIHMARESQDARWRIEAVTVGPTALAYRFGYAQGEVVGPALLAALARLLARRARRIAWQRVVSYDGAGWSSIRNGSPAGRSRTGAGRAVTTSNTAPNS